MANSIEAKICVLGAQGVGKTSLVNRYVRNLPPSPSTPSTIGANFITKRTTDRETSTPLKLQIWDTAGQERFRSIAKLYYRGASAVILVYSIASRASFLELKSWMKEVREQLGNDVIVHIVGTMGDVVQKDPARREVEMEEVIAYVAGEISSEKEAQAPVAVEMSRGWSFGMERSSSRRGRQSASTVTTPPTGSYGTNQNQAKRQSGYGWEQELGWDVCHEISAQSGEGIDEVFRVLIRKLVEKDIKRQERDAVMSAAITPYSQVDGTGSPDYFGRPLNSTNGSFRLTADPNKRRSWLGFPSTPSLGMGEHHVDIRQDKDRGGSGRCC